MICQKENLALLSLLSGYHVKNNSGQPEQGMTCTKLNKIKLRFRRDLFT